MSQRPTTPARYLRTRALLTSIAVVWLASPAAVVVGGYLPDLPTVGRLGLYLTTHLPVIILLATPSLLLAGIAMRLGGGRFTKLLLGVIAVVIGGAAVAGGALWATAASNGAAYSPIQQIAATPDFGTAEERIVFATVEGIDLRADVWAGAPNAAGGSPRTPALVFIHGGSFVAGGLGSKPWLYRAVADAGFTVIDIEYRLAPPPRWKDAPGDVLCALAWVREHGQGLGIDIERVVLAGESAGGSLALTAGYFAGLEPGGVPAHIRSSCSGTPVVPSGIVAIEPAGDLTGIWQDWTIQGGARAAAPIEAYIGGTPLEYPDRYAIAAPWYRMRPDVPPTLIVTGANDHLVRLPRVRSIADALDDVGARYKLIVIPFADHALDGLPASAGSQLLVVLLPTFLQDPAAVVED